MTIGLAFDLLARENASPAFGRLATAIDKAAASQDRFVSTSTAAERATAKLAASELDLVAAQERMSRVSASATASIETQARAEAGRIRAQQAAAQAQAESAAAAKAQAASVPRSVSIAAAAGSKLTKGLTLPIAAAVAVSADLAAKYQKGLNTIANATDQTPRQLASASKGLLSIAKSTGTGLTALTDGLYTVEKGGLRGAKALATVKAAAQGAKAENVDLGVATSALTSIMASYGSKLSDPVKAENELIRGAGLAKTTQQDFASSLSNVVPIAASLGIGFDQVAGALDTMTQHGETAQRGADNLANFITNLAGQNQVASQSLQQLGVNTIGLSKNLGSRGLTGSLDTVLAAIAKNSNGGLVVTSAFKQAATATASLQTEISAMPPALAKQSKGFADGSVSYKDYLAYAKSLGGQQYNMARGFITTSSQAQGFNNQLKSGNSTIRTTAATLQKALGGVTGMRVALMLSGASAKNFKDNVTAVGKAADSTNGDVLGWANTSGLLSTKVDKAKASLQVAAVELGTVFLPALGKLADDGAKAANWVDGLSSTQKTIGLWVVGTLAALGPILSVGARLEVVGQGISKFAVGSATKLATFAGAEESSAARIGAATGRISTALGAAGIGLAVGQLTKSSSDGVKALGVLGSAASGAALGAAGGPWGIAIGAVAGGLGAIASGFLSSGHAADKATLQIQADMATQKQDASDLLSTLQSVNGAYNDTYKNAVISKLQSTGALNLAAKAGVNPQAIAQAALGNTSAISAINAQAAKLQAGTTRGGVTTYNTGALSAIQGIENALGLVGPAAKKAENDWELYNAAQGKTIVSSNLLAGGVANLAKEVTGYGTALTTSNDKQVASSAYAARNSEVLKENVQAVNTSVTAQLAHGASVQKVARTYSTQIGQLETNAVQLGFNKASVDALIGRYAQLPKNVVTQLEQHGIPGVSSLVLGLLGLLGKVPQAKNTDLTASDHASTVIGNVRGHLDNLPPSKTIDIVTNVITNHSTNTASVAQKGQAGGLIGAKQGSAAGSRSWTRDGKLPPGYSTVGERGWELVHTDARGRSEVLSHADSMAVTGMPDRLPGFAAGTTSATGVYRVGSGWGFQGQYYGGKTGQKDALSARADYINGQRAAALYHSPESRATVVTDTGSYRSAIASADLTSTASAYTTLVTDAKAAGANSAALAKLSAAERTIVADLQKRATITDQVTKATDNLTSLQSSAADLKSSVASALSSPFDVSSAGQPFSDRAPTVDSILADLTAKADKSVAFGNLLQTLGKEGLNPALVQQLAQAGPAAYDQAQALAAATPAKLAAVNSQFSRVSTASTSAGGYVSGLVFGSQINIASALLNGYDPKKNPAMGAAVTALAASLFGAGKASGVGLQKGLLGQQKAAGDAAAALGAQVEASLRKSLGIHSPSRVTRGLGQFTGIGFALGLEDTVARVSQASAAVSGAGVLTPSASGGGNGGGGNVTNHYHHWEIHEADNGMEVHHQVMRRLALSNP